MSGPYEGLRSSEVAQAAGVNPQTLRYYERRGLLAEPERTLGGHRLYPAEAVTVLRVIKTAQRLGFTLEEVADLLETGTHQHGRRDAGLLERARLKLIEVEERIADLEIIRATLREAIDAGCDDLIACAGQPCCPLPFADLAHPDRPTQRDQE
ncbi:MerR family transcriptional regulator [Actinomadura alba]|uniref:MerR family transcriptional regulator n=1 Tax=Actinomadura alba TaxID=406431 RepID=A0ABR7LWT8_9ACTN|nr:MerR family transcriptional regulator [Actinomadura alba]MBC6468972.1 MerR family transcriptional regulator [Actinomadura alba]